MSLIALINKIIIAAVVGTLVGGAVLAGLAALIYKKMSVPSQQGQFYADDNVDVEMD